MNNPPETPAETARVLRERARLLARDPKPEGEPSALIEVLEFRLAHERYAVETAHVREVHPLDALTPLPCTPPFIAGIVNVRGRVLAVLDIKKFFDLPENGIADAHQIVLIEADDAELGILADTVAGVRSIPLETIQPSLPTLTGIREDYLKGIAAEQLVILDAARIIGDPRILVNEVVEP